MNKIKEELIKWLKAFGILLIILGVVAIIIIGIYYCQILIIILLLLGLVWIIKRELLD